MSAAFFKVPPWRWGESQGGGVRRRRSVTGWLSRPDPDHGREALIPPQAVQ